MLEQFHQEGIRLIEGMARALVDDEDSVKVEVMQGERTTVFNLRVAQGDVGKIIGRSGRTASALRLVILGWSAKHRKRSVLEILE